MEYVTSNNTNWCVIWDCSWDYNCKHQSLTCKGTHTLWMIILRLQLLIFDNGQVLSRLMISKKMWSKSKIKNVMWDLHGTTIESVNQNQALTMMLYDWHYKTDSSPSQGRDSHQFQRSKYLPNIRLEQKESKYSGNTKILASEVKGESC